MTKIKYNPMICGFCKQEIGIKDIEGKGIKGLLENKISPIRGTLKIVLICPHCYAILGIK